MAAALPTTIGFIGIGTINSAVITGLCTLPNPPTKVVLSPRNAKRAADLASRFPGIVTVASSNQEVLDTTNFVFLAVLPKQVPEVLGSLSFTPEHFVVSLVAGVSNTKLSDLMPTVPSASIVRAVPLPPVKDQAGVTLVYPNSPVPVALFDALGTAVAVDSEQTMSKMQVTTAMMGTYYAFIHSMHSWQIEQGVDSEPASKYVGALMHSIANDGKLAGTEGFDELIAEQTPGGLNEQGIRELTSAGVMDEFKATMSSIDARWSGLAEASEKRPATVRDKREAKAKLMWAAGGFMAGVIAAVAVLKASRK